MKKNSGFTLVEVMIATVILVLAIVSTFSLFGYSLSLTETDRDLTIARCEAERQMEQITAMDYVSIRDSFTNNGALRATTFTITGLNGSGTIYAQELPGAANGLMRIKVMLCYQQKNRIIGEDTNLNGVLDAGEDANGNQELDSPCEIETVVANMI